METQRITNLLNKSDLDNKKFVTKKWYIINSQTTPPYNIGYHIKFDTKVIKVIKVINTKVIKSV